VGYVIAKLHRFYGPAPTPSLNWLDVPQWLFEVYDRAQPRLEAEEAQAWIKTLAAGSGHLEEGDYHAYHQELANQAQGVKGDVRKAIRPKSADEMRMLISGLDLRGFKVDIKD
jgi:hypothetical protein